MRTDKKLAFTAKSFLVPLFGNNTNIHPDIEFNFRISLTNSQASVWQKENLVDLLSSTYLQLTVKLMIAVKQVTIIFKTPLDYRTYGIADESRNYDDFMGSSIWWNCKKFRRAAEMSTNRGMRGYYKSQILLDFWNFCNALKAYKGFFMWLHHCFMRNQVNDPFGNSTCSANSIRSYHKWKIAYCNQVVDCIPKKYSSHMKYEAFPDDVIFKELWRFKTVEASPP